MICRQLLKAEKVCLRLHQVGVLHTKISNAVSKNDEFGVNCVISVLTHGFLCSVSSFQWFITDCSPLFLLSLSRCEEELRQDQQQLLEGISELDIQTGGIPSQLLVHGALAFPLGLDASLGCFLAAARYGQGRVVVAAHEGMLCAPKMGPFLQCCALAGQRPDRQSWGEHEVKKPVCPSVGAWPEMQSGAPSDW